MAETNSAVKFYRTTSSAFSSATKEDGALYFLTDVGKIYLVVGTGSSQSLYQMSVSPSDIVSNVAQGDGNGQIKVTKNGSASNVSVKGLKSAAYTESTDYATSGHTHDTRYVRFDTSSQGLTSTQKSNARTNIGAGTSSFSGSYNDLTNKPTIPTDTNQKIKVGSVTFGNNDVIDIVAGDNVTVTGLASGTGAPKITISAGGSGGSTLYRHNLEWVFKTGSSSSGYIYTHFYAYLITNSSTAYTYSTYFGSITTLFKKTVLCGGLYDYSSQEDYGYDGISTEWQPSYSKSGNLNGVYIRYMREGSSTWDSSTYITSSTTAYSFTDTVETLG